MRILATLALWVTLSAALLGGFNGATTLAIEKADDATASNITLDTSSALVVLSTEQHDASTPSVTWMVKPSRPTRTPVPEWDSPPFDPTLDVPAPNAESRRLLAVYQANAPRNNIPERVMAGPSASSRNAPSNDGGTRQIMFHQDSIFEQFRWAASIFRSMMLDPQNVAPDHPGLSQNGEIWPRQMRQGGHLVSSASSGGELDLSQDLILEFPFGEGNSYFGADFANLNPPGRAHRRHIPSNHLLIFGYHRQDIALERPLYIGMITREGFRETSRTNWHWCPVVNYDATAGPARNIHGYAWQGINPGFRLGVIAYFLRDWLMNTPFVKQPRRDFRRIVESDEWFDLIQGDNYEDLEVD
ncbi:hypothetical protein F5Y10DRAFT_211157 [Nemania abortiva]|nr:hypothetical protein F5Y10DRAFT_211157 [Nemania abortiva]